MMKRLLGPTMIAFGAAALVGLAAGRARADGPAAPLPKGPPPAGAVQVAPPASAPVVAPPLMSAPPVGAACCVAPACEMPLKKVCVGEQAVRTIDRRVYGESCEDFCVPKCSLFGGLPKFGHRHDDCGDGCGACPAGGCDGGCASCEHHARVRKYLVVKIRHEEQSYNACHVEYQP